MDSRQETIQTILELIQSIEPRTKGMHPDELKQEVMNSHRINLDEDDEDKLEILMEKLARIKKTRPQHNSKAMGPLTAVHGTPGPISIQTIALTDFKVNDRIRHKNCPDWGEGDIVQIEPFSIGQETLQKLHVIFNMVGRKTIIVRPGMVEKIISNIVVKESNVANPSNA